MQRSQGTQSNRRAEATSKRRIVQQKGYLDDAVQMAGDVACSFAKCVDAELIRCTNDLKNHWNSQTNAEDRCRFLCRAAGCVARAIDVTTGMKLFPTQIRAGLLVAHGTICEMQTGEGKTLSMAIPTFIAALAGRGVHVATPNDYLARRDHCQLSPAFELLGISSSVLESDQTASKTAACYRTDITYGAGFRFGFDFLRDLSSKQNIPSMRLGEETLRILRGTDSARVTLQRPFHAAIVDEADHVLLDDAVSPLVLSAVGNENATDALLFRHAHNLAVTLEVSNDFTVHGRELHLTDLGMKKVYREDPQRRFSDVAWRRPWHDYVTLALRANHTVSRDIDYVVQDSRIRIVDSSTGRIYQDRFWSDGLHQAVEAKESLDVRSSSKSLAGITRQRFYRKYPFLAGTTGTAAGCEREFAEMYGLPIVPVPLRCPSQRDVLPPIATIDRHTKYAAIASETQQMFSKGRPVLIGTPNIAASRELSEVLRQQGIPFIVLNGTQDSQEASIVSDAGKPKAVTISTNLAGRGTDIKLAANSIASGGLHVIVSEIAESARIDRQLIGRGARAGDPGSARVFLSASDSVFETESPWISRGLLRILNGNSTIELNPRLTATVSRHIAKLQRRLEQRSAAKRWQLFQSDEKQRDLFIRHKRSRSLVEAS